MILLVLRFLRDLADNSSGRLKLSTGSINGLIIYKESSSLLMQVMEMLSFLNPQIRPLKKDDPYKSTYRFLKVFMGIFHKYISGKYINFAV